MLGCPSFKELHQTRPASRVSRDRRRAQTPLGFLMCTSYCDSYTSKTSRFLRRHGSILPLDMRTWKCKYAWLFLYLYDILKASVKNVRPFRCSVEITEINAQMNAILIANVWWGESCESVKPSSWTSNLSHTSSWISRGEKSLILIWWTKNLYYQNNCTSIGSSGQAWWRKSQVH